jgi:hypothetical protein
MRYCLLSFLLIFASMCVPASHAATPEFRIERLPVDSGAELLTVFGRVPQSAPGQIAEIPLLAVLRDTLGDQDPENDRLRYVWVLTSSRPTLLQRAMGSLPFFYWRTHVTHAADKRPEPVLDLGAPARPVLTSLAGSTTQVLALDPEGALIRSSTRSYRNNLQDSHRLHLLEGLTVISGLEDRPDGTAVFSQEELVEIETRLMLAGHTLGGFVSASRLDSAYAKERARTQETRGHNWELLRQRAEANGLYFEPFGADGDSTHALLWIDRNDLGDHKFDGQFLAISDPYRDPRLKQWTGYQETRDGKQMIPLALYALDYPKVPLLLVDFRDTHRPKRREMIRHAVTDTVSGILGISRFGNWPFFTGATIFNFVQVRHGAANDRSARLRSYAEVREWLALESTMDQSIQPGLRKDLQDRLEIMGVNPMEETIASEAKLARDQYAALLRYAADPSGLPSRLRHDRQSEVLAYDHGVAARFGFAVAHAATLGGYTHRDKESEDAQNRLKDARRIEREIRFLEAVAKSSPRPEIVWNMNEVRRALDDVASAKLPAGSAKLVQQIMASTNDEQTRLACARVLQSAQAVTEAGAAAQQ